MLKRLPVGLQTFRKLREGDYLYVDKTELIYRLITTGEVYFLSRPRRFGKSLLVSTLEEIFSGHRELFKGLWIYDADYDWEEHPVLRLNLDLERVRSVEELEEFLVSYLGEIGWEMEIEVKPSAPQRMLRQLIKGLARRKRVVVLVDEYDKPLIDNLENLEEAKRIREVLKGFYTVLKAMDEHLRFVLLTGVSKFSKAGVFSGLNNLNDITLHRRYATLLGITQEELEEYFDEHIGAFAADVGLGREELLARIREWYDGFCFAPNAPRVYNPHSLLMLFDTHRFANYWFETGTPTFLIKLLRERSLGLREIEDALLEEIEFSSYDIEALAVYPLLIQTGYLTIKGYDEGEQVYRLSYPNREVEVAFTKRLLEEFVGVEWEDWRLYSERMVKALAEGDMEGFFEVLDIFYGWIPYGVQLKSDGILSGVQNGRVKSGGGGRDATGTDRCGGGGGEERVYF